MQDLQTAKIRLGLKEPVRRKNARVKPIAKTGEAKQREIRGEKGKTARTLTS